MKTVFPPEMLLDHSGFLGKTGSGKTSTVKLLIEQVVADESRVCIIDPIKSDYLGLKSNADGKRAGLPFAILGGPRQDVPLHPSSGRAIADVVANGSLPLSILDMSMFPAGGHSEFFVAFAERLLQKMRGVLYLVIEEAHIFAPKERSGIGQENMSIHWAKMLATAGRTKGLRLQVVTQRTQALHNAMIGMCGSIVAHRMTAPADQAPVIKWLMANAPKENALEIKDSLAGLVKGEGWLCCSDIKLFERLKFPKFKTYDNTSTPIDDTQLEDVKLAKVDSDKLREIIGEAVEQAEANDPKKLKEKVASLEKQVEKLSRTAHVASEKAVASVAGKVQKSDPRLGDLRAANAELTRQVGALTKFVGGLEARAMRLLDTDVAAAVLDQAGVALRRHIDAEKRDVLAIGTDAKSLLARLAKSNGSPPAVLQAAGGDPKGEVVNHVAKVEMPTKHQSRPSGGDRMPAGERAVLIACAMSPDGCSRSQIMVLTGYKKSSVNTYIQKQTSSGNLEQSGDFFIATSGGIAALGDFEQLPTGDRLRDYWLDKLPTGEMAILRRLCDLHPEWCDREALQEHTGYKKSSVNTYIQKLSARRLVDVHDDKGVRACDTLFG